MLWPEFHRFARGILYRVAGGLSPDGLWEAMQWFFETVT
jgi:hypothetical protein